MATREQLGARIREHRLKQRYSVQSAAKTAQISRDTWNKIEAGESVLDTKRQAALDLLHLDAEGEPIPPAPEMEVRASTALEMGPPHVLIRMLREAADILERDPNAIERVEMTPRELAEYREWARLRAERLAEEGGDGNVDDSGDSAPMTIAARKMPRPPGGSSADPE